MSVTERRPVVIGERYGRLVVIANGGKGADRRYLAVCKCDCGNTCTVMEKHLRSGNTQSCGCLKRDRGIKANTTHGHSKTHLYRIWASMKDRCKREDCTGFENYGGRGITVCQEWETFEPFHEWALSHGYSSGLTIDRIDVNGNYCPENCRWATMKEQGNNKRDTVKITFNGTTHSLKEWSEILGVNYYTMHKRYKAGKPVEEILKVGEA